MTLAVGSSLLLRPELPANCNIIVSNVLSERYNGLRLLFYLIVIVCQSSLHLDLDVTIKSRFQIANQINLDQLTLVCDLQILLCSQIVNQINISPILVRFPNLFASE